MNSGHFRIQLLTGACLTAAALAPAPVCAQEAQRYAPERFDDAWQVQPGADAPFGAAFKNIPVSDNVTLSIGGDARWRVAYLDAPRLGLGAEADEWALQRLLLHADLRFGDDARVFVQLGAHDGVDRDLPSATDDDKADIQQAFVDTYTPLADGRLTLRLGRQELVLGPRFVTTRDSGNVRQRHDMARIMYTRGPWRADLFGGNPVTSDSGAFDDNADLSQAFYGARLQRKLSHSALDAYIYELDRDAATLAGVTAADDRLSLGARWFGRLDGADFDSEVMVQRGSFGGHDIRAVGATLDAGYRFEDAPFSPRLGARVTYGSGDADLTDETVGVFAPPFSTSQWFGQNGLASYSNIVEAAALAGLNLASEVTLNLKLSSVWRAETADFVYAGTAALPGTSGGDEAYVGTSLAASLAWRPNENVTFNPYISYVAVGDELVRRGAHDVTYAHFTVTMRF